MSLPVSALRTPRQKARFGNFQSANMCELCGVDIKNPSKARMAAVDHECYEFVSVEEAAERGQAVSLFALGPDCHRKVRNWFSTRKMTLCEAVY